jgi:alpha-1,3-mannosyltransferase
MALNEAPTPLTPSTTQLSGSHSPDQAVIVIQKFYFKNWSSILLCLEFLLDVYFLHHGPLHPIDYPTYLLQARQIRFGERDYAKIYGPTGPLVYPGGHVIIFSFFEKLFGIKGDSNWPGYLPAQWIFLALQLGHTYVCISIHRIADRIKR